MSLLSPWGLWWMVTLPLLVAFYLFRPEPRRQLSTTFFLWRRSAPDSQGGVFARRLRSNPLMWLQLLALALLALYLARPATSWSTLVPASQKVVLTVDRSASMNAPNAFEQAISKAEAAVDGLFGFGNFGAQPEVMLLAVDREPQILVPFTRDAAQLRKALRELQVSEVPDRLATLRPFFASLVSDQKATVWLFGDHLPPELEIPGVQFTACASPATTNVGLVAFSVELTEESGSWKPFLYARAENFSSTAEQRLLRVEKMSLEAPDQVEAIVFETSLLLAANGGQTLSEVFPAARLSSTEPSLFRARLLPTPGAVVSDNLPVDDTAFAVAPVYGAQRVTVSVTPDVKASFLLRALSATSQVEVLDWNRLVAGSEDRALDLLICSPNFKTPARPPVRTKFVVTEAAPASDAPVEVLRANPQELLVREAGAEWSRLRVQRDAAWAVDGEETVLLSTATGPALTLKGVADGQPSLCWRFPLAYSSLPLSPALPVIVSRFLEHYSRPASLSINGSLTTSERRSRPAGATWRGHLDLRQESGQGAVGATVEPADTQLPRLSSSGFYRAENRDNGASAVLAVNLFSAQESRLPLPRGDLSFPLEQGQAAPAAGQQQKQYREATMPLAALALFLLFVEAGVFLRRGRP